MTTESKHAPIEAIPTCGICAEPYTTVLRKRIECASCHKDLCTKCIERYLLSTIEDPHCVYCRAAWPRPFLSTACTNTFLNKTYYAHRQTILVNREKSFLPNYQLAAERTLRIRALSKEDAVILDELAKVEARHRQEIAVISNQRTAVWRRINRVRRGLPETGSDTEEPTRAVATKFVRRCTATGCNGFLSSAWKCGLCYTWVCPDCFEVKGPEKDAPHTCTPEMLQTAALIRKDTKPCPSCGEMISKIDGCFAADTPVLGWNGQVVLAKDIKVGDVLIGDDGTPRTVQSTCTGEDEMYEVTQNNGMAYTVNSKHKLALKMSGDRVIYWSEPDNSWNMRWFDHAQLAMRTKKARVTQTVSKDIAKELLEEFKTTINFPEVIEIPIDDYMKLPVSTTKNLMGFKSQGVSWPTVPVDIDPYLVGLYVGDGIHTGEAFAINAELDPEIVEYLLKWCEANNAELCHDAAYKFCVRGRGRGLGRKAIGHGATSTECAGCQGSPCSFCDLPDKPYNDTVERGRTNPLKTLLSKYDLVRNKHIPSEYIINDRQTRLALLAGLIDTDGYLSNDGKRISISQSKHSIGKQIAFLASSLGFTVTTRMLEKKGISFNGSEPKDYPDHFGINISGEALHEIPTRIPRKKCAASLPNKDCLRTGVHVKPIGKGAYYGWSLDGNKRFVLEDFTTLRNCDQMFCTTCHNPFSWITGQSIKTGVIHNPHYFQWLAKGGQPNPTNPGHVPCGGLPNPYRVQRILANATKEDRKVFLEILRICSHIGDIERPRYERHLDPVNNEDVGVRYLLKETDEDGWKSILGKQEKDRQKSNEIRDILDAFYGAAIDLFRRIDVDRPEGAYTKDEATALIMEISFELGALRRFIFQSMTDVSKSFHCSVPLISEDWCLEHGLPSNLARKKRLAEEEKQKEKDKEKEKLATAVAAVTAVLETQP